MIPTTLKMDGLLTDDDIANRFIVHKQCRKCSLWTRLDKKKADHTCKHCGSDDFDQQSTISDRTFNPMTKRKIK